MSKHIEYMDDEQNSHHQREELELGNYVETPVDHKDINEEGMVMVKPLSSPYGYMMLNLPKEITDDLNSFIQEKIDTNFDGMEQMNTDLAGYIKNEYRMPDFMAEKIKPIVFSMAGYHMNTFPYANKQIQMLSGISSSIKDSSDVEQVNNSLKDLRLTLDTYWVNLQKKYEFNPLHSHAGLFSFVIWLKVPYKHEDETSYWAERGNPTTDAAGTFCFVTPGTDGSLMQDYIPVDERYEGKMVFFPAGMGHMVYPFVTSDDYRISFSGNIMMGKISD